MSKEKEKWWVSEVSLSELEKVMWKSLINRSVGSKSIVELKEIGDLKAVKGGICVETDISADKKLSLFFGRKYDKYVYRSELFYKKEVVLR